jgi:hypothetical protein
MSATASRQSPTQSTQHTAVARSATPSAWCCWQKLRVPTGQAFAAERGWADVRNEIGLGSARATVAASRAIAEGASRRVLLTRFAPDALGLLRRLD